MSGQSWVSAEENFKKGRSNGYKIRERTCPDCDNSWYPDSGGKGRRSPGFCDDCYPLYRQSVELFHTAQHRAAKRNIEFSISVEYIYEKLKGICPRTGMPFIIGSGSDYSNRHPQTPSIDKIDPSGGYTEDNTQVVCWWYNCAKQRYTDKEVLEFCRAVINSYDT